jgi:Zn finger protein HypA/HybF involved in hydrogenase expression
MSGRDPLAKEQRQFKCENCGYRTTAPSRELTCRRCGGVMKDAAIPR